MTFEGDATKVVAEYRAIMKGISAMPRPTKDVVEQFEASSNVLWQLLGHYGGAAELFIVLEQAMCERQRQRAVEGFTDEHDDAHTLGELARAAACYALSEEGKEFGYADLVFGIWPFEWPDYKQKDRRTNMITAIALLIAEVERIDRKEAATAKARKENEVVADLGDM